MSDTEIKVLLVVGIFLFAAGMACWIDRSMTKKDEDEL